MKNIHFLDYNVVTISIVGSKDSYIAL